MGQIVVPPANTGHPFLFDKYRVLDTHLRLLRRYSADEQKWLSENFSIVSPSAQKCKDKCPNPVFERSSGQWTRCMDNWVSAFSKFYHHQFRDNVPFSLWFATMNKNTSSFVIQARRMTTFLLKIFSHKLERSWRLIRSRVHSHFWQELLDFVDELQCVNPGKIFHSNSIGLPSIVSKARYCANSWTMSICLPRQHLIEEFWLIFPMLNTESENMYVNLRVRETNDFFITKIKYFQWNQQFIVSTP